MPFDTAFRRDLSSKLIAMHGHRTGLDGDRSTVWPGTGDHPTWPAAEVSVEIISSDAADDGSPAGTGARTVTIYYLDDAFTEKTSTLTMNGTTAVAGPTDFYRLQRLVVATVGSNGSPVGTITLQTLTSGADKYGVIPAGDNESHSAYRTVPAGKKYMPRYISSSVAAAAATGVLAMELQATINPVTRVQTPGVWHAIDQTRNTQASYLSEHPPVLFPAGTDIRYVAFRTQGASAPEADVCLWLEELS